LPLEPPPDWRRTGNRRARTLSAERRVFALLEREPTLSAHAIAKRLRISESTASKYLRVWRERQQEAQQVAQ
jgi:transposase